MAKTQRAAFITPGPEPDRGIGSLSFRTVPVPEPGPGEALVRITAATLNFRDLIYADGTFPAAKKPNYIPLSCAAGKVVAVGDGVTRVAPGDRVSPLFALNWHDGPNPPDNRMLGGPIDGVACDYAVFDAESLVRNPDELSDLEAATLPCAGVTAWHALFGARPVRPGDWVLVQGTGGVAIAALQWAKAAEAKVVVTSSSDAKLARARAFGADLGVNYRRDTDWPAAVREALGGAGVDIVLDLVGCAQIGDCARVVKDDGLIAEIGQLAGPLSWGKEVGKPVTQVVVGNRAHHEAALAFCVEYRIRPVVETAYPLDQLAAAMRHQSSGAFAGKIGINMLGC